MKLPLDQIIIGPRQRIELGDLSDLDSMADKEVGLIQPIVVTKTLAGYELVGGRRRLAKATELGWPEIEVTLKDQLTPMQHQKMEYFEDLGRKDRTWQEVCIALSRLHQMITYDKVAEGESWTVRAMASYTGWSKSHVSYMLTVANALQKEPKDTEMWGCGSLTEAFKVLLDRAFKEANTELEARRQNTLSQGTLEISSAPGDVLLSDKTEEAAPRARTIYIRAYNEDFAEAKDVPIVYAVLAYNMPQNKQYRQKILDCLNNDSFAVCWWDEPCYPDSLYQLIWHKIAVEPKEDINPFQRNYAVGETISKEPSRLRQQYGSVVNCHPDASGDLPFAVVEFSLSAICTEGMAVLCPCNAPVIAVAESGRIPIFYEADKEKFNAKVQALKEWYETHYENVIVKLP